MDRVGLKDISWLKGNSGENELNESEYKADLIDNQGLCTSEFCGTVWKPLPVKSELHDEAGKS